MALLEVQGLSRAFGGLMAVADVSFQVHEREIVGMIGPNGAGKTTTFALLAGFLAPMAGTVHFAGRPITGLRPDQICRLGLARTFQMVQSFGHMTVLENVMTGAFLRHPSVAAARAKAEHVLDQVGLGSQAHTLAQSLTLAEAKRLELARALATEPLLILVDEVMAGLRPAEMEEAIALFRRLRDEGLTFLIIEHAIRAIVSVSDRVLVLHHGELLAEGPPRGVVGNARVIEAYLGEEILLA